LLRPAFFFALVVALPLFAQVEQPGQPAGQTPSAVKPDQLPNTVQAPPFTPLDKFDYRVVQMFGMKGFIGAGLGASIGQALDSPYEWGEGFGGFAKRYVSGFAGNVSRQTFAATLEAAFHEDPRYFPSDAHSTMKRRAFNALKQAIYTKTDNGGDSFAYARVISAFGAGQLVGVWQPSATAGVGQGLKRGFITIGADAGYNFLQEFIPFTRPISLRHRH